MSDQPELKEFPEFPGEPMSKRYDTTRIANAIPSIHPSIGGAHDAFFNRNRHHLMMFGLDAWMDATIATTDTDDEG
jgi:hypothetical protein